ncbi:MAG: hypothetical protein QM796_06675 [Chthoniobacteraceae bacterium]
MASEPEPEKIWDEYDWERFLQQQDRKTERYMELLEKYLDDPNRDQIIAREMGWNHFLDDDGQDWANDADEHFAEPTCEDLSTAEECDDEEEESIERHPLYTASLELSLWIDELLTARKELENVPQAVQLSTQCAVAGAKLAAALCDDDVDEIGMTIAYLKRALKAATLALNAAMELQDKSVLTSAQAQTLNQRLFQIRDAIIALMGDYRAEWRRRYGENH